MAVSQKIRNFMEQGSWIRRMFEEGIELKRQFGDENVFDLSLGNPVIQPPQEFFDELRRIANDPAPGIHRYMPNAGYAETRAAVAEQLSTETGLDFTADEIVMTCGAGGALNVVLKTLLDPGDEVVIFSPFFVEYHFYADNHGGSCRVVPPDENFLPDMQALRKFPQ
ncbi:Putative aspartate aminotransferase YhdR [Geodia barretti]|uniref:Aspartate aminotransferase YhdR n=1 Tax=Geodia barretti TaxID=519541 RepID=A0AA35RSW8_GEOBA|nr:Putative aspartate aminotransferase YhdR [Geodia barretti]